MAVLATLGGLATAGKPSKQQFDNRAAVATPTRKAKSTTPTPTPKPNAATTVKGSKSNGSERVAVPTPTSKAKGLNAVNVKLARTALPSPTPSPKAKARRLEGGKNDGEATTVKGTHGTHNGDINIRTRPANHKATPTPKPLKSINLNSSRSN